VAIEKFKHRFVAQIDRIYCGTDKDRARVIYSYFMECYHALHLETRIAFCFQLVEAFSKYKGQRLLNSPRNSVLKNLLSKYSADMCVSCCEVIQSNIKPDNDAFSPYVSKAVDVVCDSNIIKLNPDFLLTIMKNIRNEVFHGDFFTKTSKWDKLMADLPDGYREDIGVVLQATIAAIAAHILLDVEFDELTTVKRKICDDREYE
jgi:hypothetical protein